MRRQLRAGLWLLALSVTPLWTASSGLAQGPESWFRAHCSRCHGMEGKGGEGPSLHRAELEHAATDEELFDVIQSGIPGTGMPGTWQLSDSQIEEVAKYVRSMGRVEVQPPPGDAERGATVYSENGCEACHILGGVGRGIGPELTRIGLMRGLDHLRDSLVKPQSHISEDYLFLRLHLASGAKLEGLRINEDAFSVQLRDANGRFHSVSKAEATRIERLRNRTIMRSYRRRLSETEIDDLVSFLAAQRGPDTAAEEAAP